MNKKKFSLYHVRWQLSTLVMLPLMVVLESYLPIYLNLPIGQAFGACIFYFVDRRIFKDG
jgi:hypothetical protein